MITFQQLLRKNRIEKPPRIRCKRFLGSPFKRGRVEEIRIVPPKKPNSAKRKIAKVKLVNGYHIRAKIPGQGHNLQKFSEVIVRGGRVRDIPGIHYILVKGNKFGKGHYSFSSTEKFERKQKRSKYGLFSFKKKAYIKEQLEKEKHLKELAEKNAVVLSEEELKAKFPIGFHRNM